MTTANDTPRIYWLPAITGFLLWLAGTALLLEDQFRSGHWDVAHLAVPILTAATCVAGVLAHHALSNWKLLSGAALVLLALLGSMLCVLNTLGRTAADRDAKLGDAMRVNRTLDSKLVDLKDAKEGAKRECVKIGPRCTQWQQRVDKLTEETASMSTLALDPKVDAVVRLAVLVGFDGDRTRAIVTAIEPAALPTFLELGAIILFGVAFPHRKHATVSAPVTVSPETSAKVETFQRSWSRDEILSDLKRMKQVGAQRFLATRYNISEGQISKLMKEFEVAGQITRKRDGQRMLIQRLT